MSALRPGRTDDRTIRIRLTDSPISRIGYWWATAVGFTWGFIWSTGPIERRHGLVIFTGMPKWTFGRGGSCVGGCYLTNHNTGERVLGHEAVHKAQWLRYGMLFPLLYLIAGRNPLKNRFEIEAGLEAGGYLPTRRTRSQPAPTRPPTLRRGRASNTP
ncbi:Fe-S oxidoreductase [Agromyces laixinhei]|uniref:Fe-S oxidoreductase n=1 Tax=Agromyces laixinhei TaxID=2585717 RepID=UPI001E3839CC|nr:Fe-S oxidoreductase [Agromyces laixinhei]